VANAQFDLGGFFRFLHGEIVAMLNGIELITADVYWHVAFVLSHVVGVRPRYS
jgi:hypothetical protein